jgi:hypothetical protein
LSERQELLDSNELVFQIEYRRIGAYYHVELASDPHCHLDYTDYTFGYRNEDWS